MEIETFYLLRDKLTGDIGWYSQHGEKYRSVLAKFGLPKPAEYFEVLETAEAPYWGQLVLEKTSEYKRFWEDAHDPSLGLGMLAPDGTMYYCRYGKHDDIAWYMGTELDVLREQGWIRVCGRDSIHASTMVKFSQMMMTEAQKKVLVPLADALEKAGKKVDSIRDILELATIIELETRFRLKLPTSEV